MTGEGPEVSARRYIERLTAAAAHARHEGDHSRLWIAADRLVRLTEGREAAPLLLRAAALAGLNEPEAARGDVHSAFRVDPGEKGLAALALSEGTLQERLAAAIHRLRAVPEPDAALLKVLTDAGYSALLLARTDGRLIEGHAFWQGESPLDLHLTAGTLSAPIPLAALRSRAFDGWSAATFVLPWPEGAGSAILSAPGALVLPAALLAPETPRLPPMAQASPSRLMVAVPAFADWPALRRCLNSVLAALEGGMRLIVVDDASTDPELVTGLAAMAAAHGFSVLHNTANLGFAGSVNRALALRAAGEDVLLLNSDATLPAGTLARLYTLSGAGPDIGTLTPFSNNGEDTSLPRRFLPNPEPDDARLARLDAAAFRANGDRLIEIPNGVGFCLYLTSAVIETVGGFSGHYERGYFEDVDYCLRAAHAGFRNVCATGVYVAHAGGRSFGGERQAYVRRNLARLTGRYPDFRARSTAFYQHDPLREATQALSLNYLADLEIRRILLAPTRCPRLYAEAMAQPETPALLLRPAGHGIRITSLLADFPCEITLPDIAALCRQLPDIATADAVVIDAPSVPAELCAVFAKVYPLRPMPEPNAQAFLPEEHPRIGIFAPEMTPETEASLLDLARRHPETQLVLLDALPLESEARLAASPAIAASGGITEAEFPAYIRRARLTACLFADRHYGRHDPRRALVREAGLSVLDPISPDARNPHR